MIIAADILDYTTFRVESVGGHFELVLIATDILNYVSHFKFWVPFWHMQIRVITSFLITEEGRREEGDRSQP